LEKIQVSARKCDSYDNDILIPVLKQCLSDIGGFKELIKPGLKILLKPNLLSPNPPEKAITTHPLFVEAVIKIITEITKDPGNIIIADSCVPIYPHTKKGLKKLYEKTGLINIPERTGASLNYDNSQKKINISEGISIRQVEIMKPVFEADIIINLPKFKTHNLTIMTGAVKNMFGIIPGMAKPGLHTSFFEVDKFSDMLLDVAYAMKPQINIMDGILGMQGNGPGNGGVPISTNIVLASKDAISLDNIVSFMMDIDISSNPVMLQAQKRNFNGSSIDQIEVLGSNLNDLKLNDFLLPDTKNKDLSSGAQKNKIIKTFLNFAKNSLNPYPFINTGKCTKCDTCFNICPANAIRSANEIKNPLKFDYSKCIKCFCCAEACPEGAIDNRYNFIGNLIINRYSLGKKK